MRSIMDGEMQCVSAGTTITIVVVVDVGVAFSVGLASSFCPGVGLAFSDCSHVVRAVEDGQMQGVGAGTIIAVVVVMDIGAAFGVGLSCTCCPCVAFALSDGGHVVRTIMDGQVQGVST